MRSTEYIPNEPIWILLVNFDCENPKARNYACWFNELKYSQEEVRFDKRDRKKEGKKSILEPIKFVPTTSLKISKNNGYKWWFVFDLANGHAPCRRYLWFFETRSKAREFKKIHKKIPTHVPYSKPFLFQMSANGG
jgi:hypothetical protein